MPAAMNPPEVTRWAVLDFVRDFARERGYSPSIREIGEGVGVASFSSVHFHLTALAAAGLLTWESGRNRSIRVVNPVSAACCVTCGQALPERNT